MYPWFGSSFECAVVEVICGHHSLSDGLADDLDTLLAGMQSTAVQGLIFSSFPRLQMPPIVAQFNNLEVIKIYNCTIESWDGEASLTGANHPAVQLVYIVNTNMSNVPRGLLSDDFPPMLTDIEFSSTNLTGLPSEVSTKWYRVNFFILEGSPKVSEFPAPLAALQIAKMSLSSNNITTIPDKLLRNQVTWKLKLANNPLRRLPERIGDVSKMYELDIGHTLVADLPAWLKVNSSSVTGNIWGTNRTHPEVTVDLKAGGSSLCTGGEQSALESKINPLFRLNCTEDPSISSKYLYPVEAEIQWRKH